MHAVAMTASAICGLVGVFSIGVSFYALFDNHDLEAIYYLLFGSMLVRAAVWLHAKRHESDKRHAN